MLRTSTLILLFIISLIFSTTVTLSGHWYIKDDQDDLVPGEGCIVYIWDKDVTYDGLIGYCYIGSDGSFSYSFDNNDCWYYTCDIYDPYVEFRTEGVGGNLACYYVYEDGVVNSSYGFSTEGNYINNISSNHDLGNLSVNASDPTPVNAFKVFYSMKQSMKFLDNHGGQPLHYIKCFYPADASQFVHSLINGYIEIATADYAYGSTTIHELGHAVMFYQMGEWLPDGHYSPHHFYDLTTSSFAFKEGWATFFAMCVKNDPGWIYSSGQRSQLEYGGCYDPLSWVHNSQPSYGDACEGRVIMALWDLYDSYNEYSPFDNQSTIQPTGINCYLNNSYKAYDVNFGLAQDYYNGGSNFFTKTWQNMYNNHIDNLQELWNNFKNTISSEARAQALQTFKNNTIDYYPTDLTYNGITFSGTERIQAKNSVTISSSSFSASANVVIESNNAISILSGTSILENSNVYIGSVNKFSCIQDPVAKEITHNVYWNENKDSIILDNEDVSEKNALTISPNPFNPSTTIKFTIPLQKDDFGTVPVCLSVYNVQGKLIKSLLNNNKMTTGTYKILWDGHDDYGKKVSTGIYLCHLTYSNSRMVSLLILNK